MKLKEKLKGTKIKDISFGLCNIKGECIHGVRVTFTGKDIVERVFIPIKNYFFLEDKKEVSNLIQEKLVEQLEQELS